MGDFNAEEANIHIKDFCNLYKLKDLIKVLACFKNPDNPNTIDLMLTNSVRGFPNSFVLEIGLSEFHKITVTVVKHTWKRNKLKLYLIGTLGNYQTMILEQKFCEIFQLCIYLVIPRPEICMQIFALGLLISMPLPPPPKRKSILEPIVLL